MKGVYGRKGETGKMLLQFNVTNALSFKDEAILDLIADTDSSHEENLIKNKNSKVLPSIAIYGANAYLI